MSADSSKRQMGGRDCALLSPSPMALYIAKRQREQEAIDRELERRWAEYCDRCYTSRLSVRL
jgi:hypothetical protein